MLLLVKGVSTLLTGIKEVKNCCSQVRQGCDSLHLDRIPVLQWVIQDARGVNHLPAKIFEVCVPDIERLGGEGIRLHVHVCSGYLVDET